MTVLTWSDDRVEQLKKLWEAGLSASQIAVELGRVTRNAVIGKAHRLGLSGRSKAPIIARPRQHRARVARVTYEPRRPTRVAIALAEIGEVDNGPAQVAYDNVIPITQRRSLAELTEATCHWPVGDPAMREFFFCGGKTLTGLPYCAHHARVAYMSAAERRRKAEDRITAKASRA
jgi:GcrA cell cycle regulator